MNRRGNKKKGIKFENKVKSSLNSGSLWMSPLDLQSKENYIEVKYTDKTGYRIGLDLLEKIWGQSLSMSKLPYLIIGIKRDDEQIFVLHCQLNIESRKGMPNA